jgi:2-polyprenyl-6-methoxyphenol hydroxylase-like FAD-dependent oxidoreductase
MSRNPKKAIIIGGSIAGLFAALHLQRVGWHVDVYERVDAGMEARGAGIVTHPELFDALKAVGIDPNDDIGVSVPGRVTFKQTGEVQERMDLPQVLTSWGRLYQVLLARFGQDNYHQGKVFDRLTQDEDKKTVTAFFSDGSSSTGDLLIGADGIRSNVREQFEPQCEVQYAGYVCWRGLIDESALSERALSEMFPYFAFSLPKSEQGLGYPVAGDGNVMTPGKRRYNLVWYRPADQETTLKHLLTDTNGQMNGSSIAPNKIRKEVLDELRSDANRLLSPQFAEAFSTLPQPFIQPIFDLTVESMVYGNVAIIGDAAFVARPHVGMGVTKAAVDGQFLAQCLSESDDQASALERFNQARHAEGAFIIERARKLGAYMQAHIKTPQERAQAEAFRSAQAVMNETATAGFLEPFRAERTGVE